MLRKIGMLMLLTSVSWACKKDYIDGPAGACTAYMPRSEGPTADESAKWVSDEKPPRHQQPAWETGEVKADNLQNTDVAFRNPPKDCPPEKGVWTGSHCLPKEEPGTGKKSTFTLKGADR